MGRTKTAPHGIDIVDTHRACLDVSTYITHFIYIWMYVLHVRNSNTNIHSIKRKRESSCRRVCICVSVFDSIHSSVCFLLLSDRFALVWVCMEALFPVTVCFRWNVRANSLSHKYDTDSLLISGEHGGFENTSTILFSCHCTIHNISCWWNSHK